MSKGGTAYRCPKCRKRMKFVSAGSYEGAPTTRWRCPRCGTEAMIGGD